MPSRQLSTATFGGGCFWCTEAIFQRLKGVATVAPGYAGGTKVNPTYEEVCSGSTGHAEVIQVTFDPTTLSYEQLLEVFFRLHDPTAVNRQGGDVGTQYRSAIFYSDDEQKRMAETLKERLDQSGDYTQPIMTEIKPLDTFYPAGHDHQNYYNSNSTAPYCALVIDPKIEKLYKDFGELTKPQEA